MKSTSGVGKSLCSACGGREHSEPEGMKGAECKMRLERQMGSGSCGVSSAQGMGFRFYSESSESSRCVFCKGRSG